MSKYKYLHILGKLHYTLYMAYEIYYSFYAMHFVYVGNTKAVYTAAGTNSEHPVEHPTEQKTC